MYLRTNKCRLCFCNRTQNIRLLFYFTRVRILQLPNIYNIYFCNYIFYKTYFYKVLAGNTSVFSHKENLYNTQNVKEEVQELFDSRLPILFSFYFNIKDFCLQKLRMWNGSFLCQLSRDTRTFRRDKNRK